MIRAVVSLALPGASPAMIVSVFPCQTLANVGSTAAAGLVAAAGLAAGDAAGALAGDAAAEGAAGLAAAAGEALAGVDALAAAVGDAGADWVQAEISNMPASASTADALGGRRRSLLSTRCPFTVQQTFMAANSRLCLHRPSTARCPRVIRCLTTCG